MINVRAHIGTAFHAIECSIPCVHHRITPKSNGANAGQCWSIPLLQAAFFVLVQDLSYLYFTEEFFWREGDGAMVRAFPTLFHLIWGCTWLPPVARLLLKAPWTSDKVWSLKARRSVHGLSNFKLCPVSVIYTISLSLCFFLFSSSTSPNLPRRVVALSLSPLGI